MSTNTWTTAPTMIGKLVAEIFESRNWQNRLELHRLWDFWDELVGPEIAMRAQPYIIRGTTLWLSVADSVWMQQLQFEKILLLDRVNARLKQGKLTDIRFRLDLSLGEPKIPSRPLQSIDFLAPPVEEKARFEQLLASLQDDELRAVLRNLWLQAWQIKR